MVQKLESIRDATVAQCKNRTKPLTVNGVVECFVELKTVLDSMTPEEILAREAVIRDNALLFSLAFMTVGYQQLPVALYAKAFSMRSMLDLAVGELSITPKEEGSLLITLNSLEECRVLEERTDIPEISYINELVGRDVQKSKQELALSRSHLNAIPELEQPLFIQLTHLRRDILAAAVMSDFDTLETKFRSFSQKLDKIKAHLDQSVGKPDISAITAAQLKNTGLFLDWYKTGVPIAEVKLNAPDLADEFERLQKMLPALDVLVMTRRWTLRSTDLYPYVAELISIGQKLPVLKEYSSFEDTQLPTDFALNSMTKYEYITKYMVRRAWVEIYKLLNSNEPVSEALSSIYNQLLTMKRCLLEVQNAGGISNMRELYPFQMKLTSLDALRQDGKFVVDGEIPPGQGVVIGILTECFDMVYEMKIELDEKGEEEGDDSLLVDDGDEEFSDESEDYRGEEADNVDEATYASSIASKTSM